MRQVPILDFVKEAFELEKQKQKDLDIHCEVTIDGYSDFIFINRFGQAQHQATLNKAIRRIIRDCNDEQFEKSEEPEVRRSKKSSVFLCDNITESGKEI